MIRDDNGVQVTPTSDGRAEKGATRSLRPGEDICLGPYNLVPVAGGLISVAVMAAILLAGSFLSPGGATAAGCKVRARSIGDGRGGCPFPRRPRYVCLSWRFPHGT